MLYIIATPIGNLGDITFRAIETLKSVNYILCEDTRRTVNILRHYCIEKKLISYNEHSQFRKNEQIILELKQGMNIALVSDAGMPAISDTGKLLVRLCHENDIKVSIIPGPNAAISAFAASGFGDDFCFVGFLDKKESKKKKLFDEIKNSKRTYIFYESPYRLIKTLKLLSEQMPNSKVLVAREMTKKFEEFFVGNTVDAYQKFKDKNIKGELTLAVRSDFLTTNK